MSGQSAGAGLYKSPPSLAPFYSFGQGLGKHGTRGGFGRKGGFRPVYSPLALARSIRRRRRYFSLQQRGANGSRECAPEIGHATKQSMLPRGEMDCFASLAMTGPITEPACLIFSYAAAKSASGIGSHSAACLTEPCASGCASRSGSADRPQRANVFESRSR